MASMLNKPPQSQQMNVQLEVHWYCLTSSLLLAKVHELLKEALRIDQLRAPVRHTERSAL